MYCSNCGGEIRAEHTFCGHCGFDLSTDSEKDTFITQTKKTSSLNGCWKVFAVLLGAIGGVFVGAFIGGAIGSSSGLEGLGAGILIGGFIGLVAGGVGVGIAVSK